MNASDTKRKTETRRRNGMAVRADTDKTAKEHVGSGEQLLPGIPNEITIDLITPKLPWTAFHVLSSVSRCWQEAIQTNQVYEARVRANATETLLVHVHNYDVKNVALALYSTSEKCCYELPRIPCLDGGIVNTSTCIAMDGKLYVLGGHQDFGGERVVRDSADIRGFRLSDRVYVMDLAGQRGWKQRASMPEARSRFGCGIMDGKIYIFGGIVVEGKVYKTVLQSEVYDTQENAWSPITPMPMTRNGSGRWLATVGKELFLYHGDISILQVYSPAKNEWRLVETFCEEYRWPLFMKNEKFYSLSHSVIDVYDGEQHSWVNQMTNSFTTLLPDNAAAITPLFILAVKDELLLEAVYANAKGLKLKSFQCKGFDTEKKEMVWQNTNCSVTDCVLFKCSIQL